MDVGIRRLTARGRSKHTVDTKFPFLDPKAVTDKPTSWA
ncbi:hypothetical protein BH11ACT6_BH11ACT6_22130 [soil metagenome]